MLTQKTGFIHPPGLEPTIFGLTRKMLYRLSQLASSNRFSHSRNLALHCRKVDHNMGLCNIQFAKAESFLVHYCLKGNPTFEIDS